MELLINKELLDQHPSLSQAFLANADAITELDSEIEKFEQEKLDIEKKQEIAKELGFSVRRIKGGLSRVKTQIEVLKRMRLVYTNGYLEVPQLADKPTTITNNPDEKEYWWTFKPTVEVPLRVYEAIKKAKEIGIFDELVVFQKEQKRDPIVAGRIKDRYFYLASYR